MVREENMAEGSGWGGTNGATETEVRASGWDVQKHTLEAGLGRNLDYWGRG